MLNEIKSRINEANQGYHTMSKMSTSKLLSGTQRKNYILPTCDKYTFLSRIEKYLFLRVFALYISMFRAIYICERIFSNTKHIKSGKV